MEEGRSLWQNKKREQLEQEIREQEEVQFFRLRIATVGSLIISCNCCVVKDHDLKQGQVLTQEGISSICFKSQLNATEANP